MTALHQAFNVDFDAGRIFAKMSRRAVPVGKELGLTVRPGRKPYKRLMLDGKVRYVHVLIWVMAHGPIPDDLLEVDHINGDTLDNRLSNLRLVTHRVNTRNRRVPADHQSGVMGVTWHPRRRQWRARIRDNRSVGVHLGWFSDKTSAVTARSDNVLNERLHRRR